MRSPDLIAFAPTLARDNPFASTRLEAIRYRLPDGLTWDGLLDRLAALDWRAAIVGPHGHGKTTLLEELASRVTASRIVTITLRDDRRRLDSSDWQRVRALGPKDILLLDGAELLSRLVWLRVRWYCRRAGGLVITSHRPGLLPTLLECETTPELLAGIVRELTGETADVEGLFDRHTGNLRTALREMYDRYGSNPAI